MKQFHRNLVFETNNQATDLRHNDIGTYRRKTTNCLIQKIENESFCRVAIYRNCQCEPDQKRKENMANLNVEMTLTARHKGQFSCVYIYIYVCGCA